MCEQCDSASCARSVEAAEYASISDDAAIARSVVALREDTSEDISRARSAEAWRHASTSNYAPPLEILDQKR